MISYGVMPSSALRNPIQFDFDPHTSAIAHLGRGAGEPGRSHVLDSQDGTGLHRFQARFQQQLLQKGVADLHVGTLGLGVLVEFGRCHRRALDAVAAGLGAYVDNRIADALGGTEKDGILAEDA